MSRTVKLLLVGEAPGYQGCRVSGIPFTSERLLLEGGIPGVPCFNRLSQDRNRAWSEPSATIVWKVLHDLGVADQTVLWNAFPFHPHHPGVPLSNRTPTNEELEFGQPFLKDVLKCCPKAVVVAVGKKATDALTKVWDDIDNFHLVRHPANGGAAKFRDQLRAVVKVYL